MARLLRHAGLPGRAPCHGYGQPGAAGTRRRSSVAATTSRCCTRGAGTARPSCSIAASAEGGLTELGSPRRAGRGEMTNCPEVQVVYQARGGPARWSRRPLPARRRGPAPRDHRLRGGAVITTPIRRQGARGGRRLGRSVVISPTAAHGAVVTLDELEEAAPAPIAPRADDDRPAALHRRDDRARQGRDAHARQPALHPLARCRRPRTARG